jgi:hypothetical protein
MTQNLGQNLSNYNIYTHRKIEDIPTTNCHNIDYLIPTTLAGHGIPLLSYPEFQVPLHARVANKNPPNGE